MSYFITMSSLADESAITSFDNSFSIHTSECLVTEETPGVDLRACAISSIVSSILSDTPVPAATRPELSSFLADKLSKNKNKILLTRIWVIFCRQNFIGLSPDGLPKLRSLLALSDTACVKAIKNIVKSSLELRALEIELNQYRDGLLHTLSHFGSEYRRDQTPEALEAFCRALVTILPCYPSQLIDLSGLTGVDHHVQSVLRQTRMLSSPFQELSEHFVRQGWAQPTTNRNFKALFSTK